MPKIVDRIRNYFQWLRDAPNRQSDIFPRLMSLGGVQLGRRDAIPKPIPVNLRTFSRTPCARHAINIIKNTVKDLDWEITPKKNIATNSEIQRQIRVVTNCLSAPNRDDSFSTFIEKVIEDFLAVSAGAYEQQVSTSSDHPLWMWPVDSSSIQEYAFWETHGDVRYKQTIVRGSQQGIDLTDEELVYITPNPSTDTPYGYGPLEITARSISRQLGAAEFAGNVASNAQPNNIIYAGDAGPQDIQAFRVYWRNEVEGLGNTPILGGKEVPKVLKLNGDDDSGLYLKWQEFLICEVARGFDLSVDTFNLQGQGVRRAQQMPDATKPAGDTNFKNAVVPMAMKIRDYINRKSILGRLGFTQVEFNWPTINAEDRKKQADIDEIRYQNNQETPNEARARRGDPPLDNPFADMLYADVQIAIGEARRGNAAGENQPGILHNQPPRALRQIARR